MAMLRAKNIALSASFCGHFIVRGGFTSQIMKTNKLLLMVAGDTEGLSARNCLSPEAGINPTMSNSAEAICFFQRHLVFQGDSAGLAPHRAVFTLNARECPRRQRALHTDTLNEHERLCALVFLTLTCGHKQRGGICAMHSAQVCTLRGNLDWSSHFAAFLSRVPESRIYVCRRKRKI